MSELVEKVARVLAGIYVDDNIDEYQLAEMKITREDYQNGAWEGFTVEARAAIRSVLAHFAEAGNVTDGMAVATFQILPDTVFGSDIKKSIAAAMAAALKEMEG